MSSAKSLHAMLISPDVGASDLIVSGKIKLKNDSHIQKFDSNGLVFEDGSKISADAVIFSTGCVRCSGLLAGSTTLFLEPVICVLLSA